MIQFQVSTTLDRPPSLTHRTPHKLLIISLIHPTQTNSHNYYDNCQITDMISNLIEGKRQQFHGIEIKGNHVIQIYCFDKSTDLIYCYQEYVWHPWHSS